MIRVFCNATGNDNVSIIPIAHVRFLLCWMTLTFIFAVCAAVIDPHVLPMGALCI